MKHPDRHYYINKQRMCTVCNRFKDMYCKSWIGGAVVAVPLAEEEAFPRQGAHM